MTKSRIEAFTDGVIAIIITIMVLELKVPHEYTAEALLGLLPVFLSYVLSFVNVGLYWNNHHHMFHSVKRVGGWVLWANLHLLFWLSLLPFSTGFMQESYFQVFPVALYAFNLTMCAVGYTLLVWSLVTEHGANSDFARALGTDRKGKISLAAYLISMPAAFVSVWISLALIAFVAIMWVVPDRRFAKAGANG
ncbi:MAG: TMEM175 family protein [Paracoccaceae bacterium]